MLVTCMPPIQSLLQIGDMFRPEPGFDFVLTF